MNYDPPRPVTLLSHPTLTISDMTGPEGTK